MTVLEQTGHKWPDHKILTENNKMKKGSISLHVQYIYRCTFVMHESPYNLSFFFFFPVDWRLENIPWEQIASGSHYFN